MRTITHRIDAAEDLGAEQRTAPVFNAATGEPRAEVLLAAADDVDRAVASAHATLRDWSQSSLSRRTGIPFAFHEIVRKAELAALITDAAGEVHLPGPDGVRFYARTRVDTQRRPEPEQAASFEMPTAR